jgi:hypothetical protein
MWWEEATEMRPILRVLAVVMLAIAILGVLAFIAGLAGGNPAQLLVGVSVAIVAAAMSAVLVYADRSIANAQSPDDGSPERRTDSPRGQGEYGE